MRPLAVILQVKIWVTISFWCVPLLLFPRSVFEWLGFIDVGSIMFLRLLGMAYLALVAGYYLGYKDFVAGLYPSSAVLVGIISNSGAFLLLVIGSVIDVWSSWGVLAKTFMWSSIVATGLIAFFLILYGPMQFGFKGKAVT